MEVPHDAELEKLIELYVERRDTRMKLTEEEIAAKQAVIAKMHEKGVRTYEHESDDGRKLVTTLNAKDPTETLKVKAVKQGELEVVVESGEGETE